VLVDVSDVEGGEMSNRNRAKNQTRANWKAESHDYKRKFRDEIVYILRRKGPTSIAEIKRMFGEKKQEYTAIAVRMLVGSNRVFKDDAGKYYAADSNLLANQFQNPFVGARELLVDGVPCGSPTNYGAGSEGKVRVLCARYHSGLPLWVKGDSKECAAPNPGQMTHRWPAPEPDYEDAEIL